MEFEICYLNAPNPVLILVIANFPTNLRFQILYYPNFDFHLNPQIKYLGFLLIRELALIA